MGSSSSMIKPVLLGAVIVNELLDAGVWMADEMREKRAKMGVGDVVAICFSVGWPWCQEKGTQVDQHVMQPHNNISTR